MTDGAKEGISLGLVEGGNAKGPVVETQVAQPNMEEVVVVGTWANLQNAADKQFADDKIISVVDSDALGNFPDSTAADAIRRLSGVNVENDQGEGRYVTIRGMSSDLNSVAVNGASVVAPENGRRSNARPAGVCHQRTRKTHVMRPPGRPLKPWPGRAGVETDL